MFVKCTTDAHVQTHLCFHRTTMGVTPSTTPTSIDFAEVKYRSTTITSIVAATAVIVTLFYLAGLCLVTHRWGRDDTSLNKYSSVRLRKSAPCTIFLFSALWRDCIDSIPTVVYLLLVLTGIIEVSSPKQRPIHPSHSEEVRSRYRLGYWCNTTTITITLPKQPRRE